MKCLLTLDLSQVLEIQPSSSTKWSVNWEKADVKVLCTEGYGMKMWVKGCRTKHSLSRLRKKPLS